MFYKSTNATFSCKKRLDSRIKKEPQPFGHGSLEGCDNLDISQTIVQGYFNMMMVADTSKSEKDAAALSKELSEIGDTIGVVIRCQHEDIFNVMHRI